MSQPLENLLREQGVVVAIDGDEVLVETQRSTGCSGCKTSACGTSVLATLFTNSAKPIRVTKTLDCQVGDKVELVLDESRLLKHSFMAYGLPLIGLFIGSIGLSKLLLIFVQLSPGLVDLVAVFGAAIGLVLGWLLTKRYYQPVLPVIDKVFSAQNSYAI